MAPRSSEQRPILCAVLDAPALGTSPGETASALFGAGVDWIQLRDRSLEADRLWQLSCALVAARDGANAKAARAVRRVLVNRRVDVTLAAGADGAHLGFDALDVESAAALLPSGALLGASLHSPAEVAALRASAPPGVTCYAHLAPIWDPISKPTTRPALGTQRLAEACASGLPVLAQGGIDAQRAAEAIRSGAAGVAVTGALGDPVRRLDAARQLRAALDGQDPPRG